MLSRICFLLAAGLLLLLAPAAHGARTVYFADPGADAIAQYGVGAGGALTALSPSSVPAAGPRRLAMTSSGLDLYATADHGVLQYDVAPDGRLSPKPQPLVKAGGKLHSIAVHPDDASVYVTDAEYGKVRQFDVAPGGGLAAKAPAYVRSGPRTTGIAVSPGGATAYVLVAGGIVVYDVGPGGALQRRAGMVHLPGCALEDVALTPSGAFLYATSRDGYIFQFRVAPDGSLTPLGSARTDPGPVGVAVAPDGTAVYAAAGGRVLGFAVGADGRLTPAGTAPLASHRPWYLSPSPDGKSLFVAAGDGGLFDLGLGPTIAPKATPTVDLEAARGVVVSPNQPPVASFAAAAPGVAGAAIAFDASGATDPDGTIARYSWDFGDGTVLPDGGPTPQHVYTSPGSYTVTLVVTDNEGASTSTIFTGGTALGNGQSVAQISRVIVIAAAPPAPVAPAQELRPDLGQTLVAEPVSGTVRVRRPGTASFVPLQDVEELPLGSTIDTRRGRVDIATERQKRGGRIQEGRFYGGLFLVRQRRSDRYVTELVLRGALSRCPASRGSAQAAASSKRRLWGDGKGRFRTRGRYSSGAVRGTRWLTEDRCDGTLTLVRRGRVKVRDFVLDRAVLVRAGERYLARRR
jgi:6-phosphogluconolactonase (cycloisomerase 2 family)